MNIEDKAYFAMKPNLQGMKKVKDEINAISRMHYDLSMDTRGSLKYNGLTLANALGFFVQRATNAVEIGMAFKGATYWNKKARELEKQGLASGVIADKLIAEALSIYNSHSKPIEDKAYFDRRIYHSTGTFQTKLDKETRVPIDGTSKWVTVDPAQYITPRRVRISGIKGEIEIAAQLSGDEIKGISAKAVKATASRQGSKAKMGFLSGTKKQQIDYVFGVGTNYGERAWKSGIKRLIDDKEALARIRLLKYELDPLSPMRNTVDKEFDKGWLRGYTNQQIQESENPPKFKKGDRVLYNTGTAKHIGTIEKVSPYAKPEAEYIVAFTTLSTGRSQLNIPESSISKSNASRTGTKTKFANRGAFAEASSSPVLGSLLEKKVMPEGGWRAVETDGAALVIAFEDNDIAGNFARRAAENGYSATAPMAMAGRFWNVKVQNENKN